MYISVTVLQNSNHTHKHTYAWRNQVKNSSPDQGKNWDTTTTNWYPTHTYTRTYMCRCYETYLKVINAETPLRRFLHKMAIKVLILLTHMSVTCSWTCTSITCDQWSKWHSHACSRCHNGCYHSPCTMKIWCNSLWWTQVYTSHI